MASPSLALGYHGCDIRVARRIISLKEQFKPSQNAWDWLGHGVYFWEDSPERAERWAHEESRRRGSKIKNPAVVGAVIDLGHWLNLADAEDLMGAGFRELDHIQVCVRSPRQIIGCFWPRP